MKSVRMKEIAFSGQSGKLADNIIRNWLLGLRKSNPAIIDMFAEREMKPARDLLPWSGEFAGKYITGAYYIYRMTLDPDLYGEIKQFIAELLSTQAENGYLGCWSHAYQLTGQPGGTWDAWGHYHVMYGLLMWYRETRDPAMLRAVEKAAALFLEKFYNPETGNRHLVEIGSTEMNLAPIHVFALLFRETGRREYLDFALRIADDLADPSAGNYLNCALEGIEYYRCPKPRWESMHVILGLAELYRATGDEKYLRACTQIWWSIRMTDVHNTGAFSTHEAAIGNPFTAGPIESCCVIAYNALAVEILKLTDDPAVADHLELSHYNACMGLWSPSGRWSTYDTPMNGVRLSNTTSIVFQSRPGSPELNCCSVNAPRAIGMLSDWAFTEKDGTLYINFYERGRFVTESGVLIRIEGDYPADGKISVHVEGHKGKLALRIPGWSILTVLTVGEKKFFPEPGAYRSLDCAGSADLKLKLDMATRTTDGDLDFKGTKSLYRGPVLFGTDTRLCGEYALNELPALDLWQIVNTPSVPCGDEIRIPLENGVTLCDFCHLGRTGAQYATWLKIES